MSTLDSKYVCSRVVLAEALGRLKCSRHTHISKSMSLPHLDVDANKHTGERWKPRNMFINARYTVSGNASTATGILLDNGNGNRRRESNARANGMCECA